MTSKPARQLRLHPVRRSRTLTTAAVMAVLTTLGCEPSESLPGPGPDLQVRAHGGQLQRGGLGEDEGGPDVTQVLRPQPEVLRGEAGVKLNGRLGPGGVALHLQAEGDPDHWIIPAKGFDFVVDDELQWAADLEFSYAIQSERITLALQASDATGRLGPVIETSLGFSPDVPPAVLLISLLWDAPVDLDLSVELPNGTVVGAKNINSYEPPPGTTPTGDDWMEGGYLDYDSNQHCELDLRNRENVLWHSEPPSGRYRVYAQLYSPCEAHTVNMIASVEYEGEQLSRATSTLYEFDSRIQPGEGDPPGLLLTEFEIP